MRQLSLQISTSSAPATPKFCACHEKRHASFILATYERSPSTLTNLRLPGKITIQHLTKICENSRNIISNARPIPNSEQRSVICQDKHFVLKKHMLRFSYFSQFQQILRLPRKVKRDQVLHLQQKVIIDLPCKVTLHHHHVLSRKWQACLMVATYEMSLTVRGQQTSLYFRKRYYDLTLLLLSDSFSWLHNYSGFFRFFIVLSLNLSMSGALKKIICLCVWVAWNESLWKHCSLKVYRQPWPKPEATTNLGNAMNPQLTKIHTLLCFKHAVLHMGRISFHQECSLTRKSFATAQCAKMYEFIDGKPTCLAHRVFSTVLGDRRHVFLERLLDGKWNLHCATILIDRQHVLTEIRYNLRFATVSGNRRRVFSQSVDFRLTLPIPPGGIE